MAWNKSNSTTRKHAHLACSIKEEWSAFQKNLTRMENMTKVIISRATVFGTRGFFAKIVYGLMQ